MSEVRFSIFKDEHYIDLTIMQYGFEQCKPLHSFGPYVRNNYLFHYVVSGKGTLRANDEKDKMQEYSLEGGSGFIIEPGYVNTYMADEKEPWTYMWIEFAGLRARECVEAMGVSQLHPVYVPDTKEHGKEIEEKMRHFVFSEDHSSMALIGQFYLLLDRMIQYSSTRRESQDGKLSEFYAKEAIRYIEGHYTEDITVEEIAKNCQLERSYFGKIFKGVIGQSPQEFLVHYRMAKAAALLTTSDRQISEIGALVGYPNALHFSRAFKRVYQISPREYRQIHRIMQ